MDINPSKGDFDKIGGLFGNWNNDPNDDFVKLRNSNQTGNDEQILNSFRYVYYISFNFYATLL